MEQNRPQLYYVRILHDKGNIRRITVIEKSGDRCKYLFGRAFASAIAATYDSNIDGYVFIHNTNYSKTGMCTSSYAIAAYDVGYVMQAIVRIIRKLQKDAASKEDL